MNHKRKTVILLIMCSVIVYGNSLNNSFVFDDEIVAVNNNFVKDLSNVRKLLSTDYLKYSGELSYRPVVTLSYFVDCALWDNDAFGFHLTNLILHVLNVISVYFLMNLIQKNKLVSLISSLLFCVHSVHTEAVDCIAFREDMICSLFFLLSFLFYIGFCRKRNITLYLLSIASFIFSLLSKEMAFTLPLVIVFYDAVLKRGFDHERGRARVYAPYLLLAAVFLYLRFFVVFNPVERAVDYPGGSFYTNILNMLRVVVYYMRLLVIPYPLCPKYVFNESATFFDMRVWGALVVLIAVLAVLFYLSRKSRVFLFGAGWFFITLIPVYNIVPLENFVAERYLYIPSFGFCVLAASLLSIAGSGKLKKSLVCFLITLIFLYSFLTIKRNSDWKNNLALWRNTVVHFPGNYLARYNLGNEYWGLGKVGEAISEYKRVIKDDPDHGNAYNNLGCVYVELKDYETAEKYWREGLRVDPGNKYIILNLKGLAAREPQDSPRPVRPE